MVTSSSLISLDKRKGKTRREKREERREKNGE
jgi:hypothetical protein